MRSEPLVARLVVLCGIDEAARILERVITEMKNGRV